MGEPLKMFSVVMPYKVYEKLRAVAYESELSVGKTIRLAVEDFLRKSELKTPQGETKE